MSKPSRITEKPIPVLIGHDYKHVMGKAVIEETPEVRSESTNQVVSPAEVVITIKASGNNAKVLGEFLTVPEVVALSFTGVAVQPRLIKNQEK